MLNELKHNQKVIDLLKRYGIRKAYLFGSQLRGDAKPTSDIDLLIDYDFDDPRMEFPAQITIEEDLEKLLGKKVSVCEREYLLPGIKEEVVSTAKIFFVNK